MAAGTIDDYAKGFDDWRGDVVRELDALVRSAAPGATASIKWAQPVYEQGGPVAYVKAFSKTVNLGFWRGVDLSDPDGVLVGTGDRMRHVAISDPADVNEARFSAWVKQAVELNASRGDPTKPR
ncbi:MAG: DUF1801 domain-containing protein [Gemmatimonadota bacterium]